MPALFIYLIKVNVALLIFCAGYYAVLRHLTFYNLNRVYLVTAILFSTIYPLANLTDFLNRHEELVKPVQVVIINWQEPVKTAVLTFLGHNQWYWLQAAFWLGVMVFGVRLLLQLLSLHRLHKLSEPAQLHQYVIRVIKGDINPFSFWRNIYINPDNHPANELSAILEHEQIHVNEWHTLDILLGELSAIFYWFNPGIWLMKRAIRENIEFITDQKILQKGVDSKAYQYSLLNVNFGAQGNTIVNHFNISTIKKRIMMMNAKRSSNLNITRYLFLIPAVMVLLLIFSVSKAELNKAVKSSAHILVIMKKAINKINFISDTTSQVKSQKTTIKSNLTVISNDTIIKGKSDKKWAINYSLSYDSAGIKGNREFHLTTTTDTNKKHAITITGNADKRPDIYVDGVKTTAGLETLNPNDISSVTVNKDDKSLPNGVIYIVTKAHDGKPAVLNIKTRPDTIVVNGKKVITLNTLYGTKVITTGGSTVNYVDGKPIIKVRLNGQDIDVPVGVDIHTIKINGDTIKNLNELKPAERRRVDSLLVKMKGMSVDAKVNLTHVFASSANPRSILNVYSRQAQQPIKFADKLIIIDGKEASAKQLKKLSADKIETISTLKDDAAITIYGEKARNGIVVITTKK